MSAAVNNRLDFMDEMLKDESVIFRKFMNFYSINKGKMLVFFEGSDDKKFYLRKLEEHFGEFDVNWSFLECDKRSNVFQLIKDLSEHSVEEYKNCQHLGFVDKDYNDIDSNDFPDKIYVTPSYSIENFYATDEFFRKILKLEFNLRDNDPNNNDFDKCFLNFVARRDEFVEGVLELDCYLKCHYIMYDTTENCFELPLKDYEIIDHVNIYLDNVVFKDSFLKVLDIDNNKFDQTILNNVKEFYSSKDKNKLISLIRGKFIFDFVCCYLYRLVCDNKDRNSKLFVDSYSNSKRGSNDPLKAKMKKTDFRFELRDHDLLSVLSKYIIYPDCLDDFIRKSLTLSKAA